MTNDRLKEMIPDVCVYALYTGRYITDVEKVQQQTENLRKAVKALIDILYPEKAIGSISEDIHRIDKLCKETIEQITGKKYAEI